MSDGQGFDGPDLESVPEPVADGPTSAERWRRAVGVVVALALVSGVLAAVALRSGPKDPDEVLADIAAFVDRAESVHIEGTQEWSTRSGKDGLGQTSTDRAKLEGDLELPTTAHLVIRDGVGMYETIAVADAVYSRDGEDEAELSAQKWDVMEMEDEEPLSEDDAASLVESGSVDSLLAAGLAVNNGLAGGGYGFPALDQLLGHLDGAERVSNDVIRVEMPVRDLVEKLLPDFDAETFEDVEGTMTVELTAGPEGRLDRMRTVVESSMDGERSTSTDDLRFSRWGQQLEIAAPGADMIDATPSFDEERLLDGGFTPLAPRTVPAPLKLLSAYFYEGDEELEECSDVSLHYADPAEEQRAMESDDEVFVRSIEIVMTAVSCTADDEWEAEGREDEVPFAVGPHRGTVVRYDDPDYGPTMDIVLVVGDVRISVTSDVPEDVTLRALAELVPLDLATQPVLELAGPGVP